MIEEGLEESAVLWDSFIEDARDWQDEIETQRQKRIEECRKRHEERLRERKASGEDNFDTELAIDFGLTKISPRRGGEGTYGRDRDILWALKAHGGEQYATDKLETSGWSGWNIHQVAKGEYYTSYSIGTFFITLNANIQISGVIFFVPTTRKITNGKKFGCLTHRI